MGWNELSMAEKAEIMKLAVQGGIYDLDAIRNGYNEYAKGGKIHIAPSKRGTFTAAASKHGKSVQAFASQVLAHPENYSPAMRKKANFARNAAKWKHEDGGVLSPYDQPQTFAGRVAQVTGASPEVVRGADVVSSVAQMTPYGHFIGAMDLGRDLNRVYHGEEGAWWDSMIDAASMLPFLKQSGIKAAKTWYNTVRNNKVARRAINGVAGAGKAGDFISDTWGANKAKKAFGGNLYDGTNKNSQQMQRRSKITFTPEQLSYIESQLSPANINKGMNANSNSSVGEAAKETGRAAIRQKNAQKAEKVARYNRQNEMYSIKPVKEASGETVYEGNYDPKVIGLSPADPVGEFVVATAALNPAFKAAETLGLYGLGRYGAKMGLEAEQNWARGTLLGREFAKAPVTVESPLSEAVAQVRTKLGDVEVDNPGLYYRQGTPEMVSDFVNKGVAEALQFPNPMFNQGELFYNFPKRKGFTLNFDRRGTNGLITTSEDMVPASGDAMPMPLSEVDETITSRIPTGKITTKNATAYNWEPGYGYRKVAQEPSTVTWSEANNPTIAAAERGRRKLRRATNSLWNKERWNEAAPFENTDVFIEDLTKQIDEVPFDYSKTKAQLNAMGETAPRAPKKWKENGRDFTDYNTGLDVSVASDLGDKAYSTGIHEPIHYMTANSNGLDVGVAKPVFGSNMDPVKLEFDATNSTVIPRGKRYQHFMVDYNDGLLPKINTQSWDYRHGNNYYLNKQENQTYLKEWFLTDVEPFLKNPNDAAEIERFLTMNPEVIENNYYINTLMKENRPGTNKDYAKALSKMLYSILGTGATTTLLNK